MPGLFDAQGDQTVTSSFLTVAGLTGATTIRPEICEIKLGASGTLADNALVWLLQLHGGGHEYGGITPSARNPANDGLHLASFGSNHTAGADHVGEVAALDPTDSPENSLIWQAYAGDGSSSQRPPTMASGFRSRRPVTPATSSRAWRGRNSNAKRTHVEMV